MPEETKIAKNSRDTELKDTKDMTIWDLIFAQTVDAMH